MVADVIAERRATDLQRVVLVSGAGIPKRRDALAVSDPGVERPPVGGAQGSEPLTTNAALIAASSWHVCESIGQRHQVLP